MDDGDHLKPQLYASLARPFLRAAPVWMDLDDLMQDARVAHLEGRLGEFGIIDGLRRSRRMAKASASKLLDRRRGWEVSMEDVGTPIPTIDPEHREVFLARHVAQLTKYQRRIVAMWVMGFSGVEIAQRLQLTETYVSLVKKRAIGRLREMMGA